MVIASSFINLIDKVELLLNVLLFLLMLGLKSFCEDVVSFEHWEPL